MTTLPERLARALDAQGDLAPPWAQFPDYTRYCLGWRMGAGEDWMMLWHHWLREGLGKAPGVRRAYLQRHPPAPRSWADAVHRVLHPDDDLSCDDDVDDDERERRARGRLEALLAAGLVADDVAWATWVALEAPPKAPWAGAWADAPEDAARYDARGLGFVTRWAARARADGTLAAWLGGASPVPEAWAAFRLSLETGTVDDHPEHRALASRLGLTPVWPPLSDGWRRLAVELAPGSPRPPWSLGMTAEDFTETYEDDGNYADAWVSWAGESFEDLPTWRAWLADHLRPPPEWAALLDAEVAVMLR